MSSPDCNTGYAPAYKGSLFYEVAGSGRPVLLIHAGVADCTMWDDQFDLFSQSYQVIRYDTRGYGKSRTETTEFSNRQDILDLFKHLGVKQCCVIGISRGGQIAIDFTLEHPECVSALVPVAAGVSGYDFHPVESEKAKREFELFTHMDELWEKKAFDELADLEVHAWADGPFQPFGRASPQIRDYIRKIVLANYTRQDGHATPRPLAPPAAGRLAEIHVPTLILVGEFDTLDTLAMAEKLESEIPHARKILFPGTAHMLPLEQSEKFSEVVLDFMKKELV